MMGQGFGKKKGALAKPMKKAPPPEDEEDEMESGEPTASDSDENKKARRGIFLQKLMGKGKKAPGC